MSEEHDQLLGLDPPGCPPARCRRRGSGLLASRAPGAAAAALERLSAASGRLSGARLGPGLATTAASRCSRMYVPAPAVEGRIHVHDERVGRAAKFTLVSSRTSSALTSADEYFATGSLVQPWDPSLISNFKQPDPFMIKAARSTASIRHPPEDLVSTRSSIAPTR